MCVKVRFNQASDLYLHISFKTALEDEESFQLGQQGKKASIFKTSLKTCVFSKYEHIILLKSLCARGSVGQEYSLVKSLTPQNLIKQKSLASHL